MIYAILDGETVTNTIVADAAFMVEAYPLGNFREVVQPAPVEPRYVSVGAFFDRFGAHKWPILADANVIVQALIKDCSVRKFVDLDDPQLDGGLAMLVDAGHAIDPVTILSAPVQASEKP